MTRRTGFFATRVCLLVLAGLASATAVQGQTTGLFLDSQPGDYVGQGIPWTYTPADSTLQVTRNFKNGISVSLTTPNVQVSWSLNFAAAGDVPLAVGAYEDARRYPVVPGNGLDVDGMNRGCNQLTGRFVVREISLAPEGTVLAFAADFEQHCEDHDPALFGAVRYNSTISDLRPFDGQYPTYQLTITPPDHGRITATGLDCGGGGINCVLTLPAPAQVTVTATPDPGHMFVGWSGDCAGAITTWVRLNQRKSCSALFEPGFQGTTALFLDSQPGDTMGRGIRQTLTPLDGTFEIFRNTRNGVGLSIAPPNFSFRWALGFAAAGDVPLAAAAYGAARDIWATTQMNGLDVAEAARGCSSRTGRFVIREIVYRSDGSVQRFAADFEQHCSDAAAGLFGAIRYNSTISDLTPFEGQYPLYQLTITPPSGGQVTGGGVDCGAGHAVCQVSISSATQLSLTVTPGAGYLFAGWLGECRGAAATTSIHVNGPRTCSAFFEPLVSASPRSLFFWHSQTGDFVGGGRQGVYSPSSSQWTLAVENTNHVSVTIDNGLERWRLDFSSPVGQPLTAGYYSAARRQPFTAFNGLDVSGLGTGCNELTGRFVVLEAVVASDGTVQRFAADFEQHCHDIVPALVGAIRYNSTITEFVPFAGAYPSFLLSMTPPINGRVTATGMNCGGIATQCLLTLMDAAQLTLTATPDPGYVFMGWTEDCSGGTTTVLHVNGPKRCGARFEPSVPSAPRTVLRWVNELGASIGQGQADVWSLANSRWTARGINGGNGVRVLVESVGPRRGLASTLEFQAPLGELLQIGRQYDGAVASPDAGVPAIVLYGNGSGCGGGAFIVRDLLLGPQDSVLVLAVDFVLNCGRTSGPVLTGSLRYNASTDGPVTTLSVDPPSLRFAALHNGASVTVQPAPQTVRLSVSRPGVTWTASANQPWVQVIPSSGTGSTTLTVRFNLLGTPPGSGAPAGRITITATDGSLSTRTFDLIGALHLVGTTASPFGVVDSPLQNATGVTGAIPMTGWVLDDLEVTGVTICRAAVVGEVAPVDPNCGGAAQIFVGNGVFIEGARPDVQAAYPMYPRSNAGGWGFMLLTNMLPNQGNGAFVFSVYGHDREGHVVLLGTRTMTCDNAHATAPFGAIDTPGQGETVSGSTYVNFGWALTQNPKVIPFDGSTLMVHVDGMPVGSPSYNHYRPDVSTTFPGLANSDGPVGFKVIDTTALSNGLHTIVWTATDSAGVTSGLGSRYFRVANGAASSVTAGARAASAIVSDASFADVPTETSPLVARRSWDAEAPWRNHAAGRTGRVVLRGEELDRFELLLGEHPGETYAGYLRVGERLRPLPIGSHLERQTGRFTWSPGVGFVGTYDLVFVRSEGARAIARREVRLILQPKGSGHVGAQVVIDTPRPRQDVAQPFALGGWAVDLDAPAGTGIDTLHVWAYPLTGGAPVFLGAATYGGGRPDVSAIHGERFRDAGFGLLVHGLVPGDYDLAVFAWSNVSGGFVPAQVVRVTAR